MVFGINSLRLEIIKAKLVVVLFGTKLEKWKEKQQNQRLYSLKKVSEM